MVKTVCRYLSSSSRNKEANIGDRLKKALIWSSESVSMLTRGVVTAARVVKNQSQGTSVVFLLCLKKFVSTRLSLLWTSKVASELWYQNFNNFRTVTMFVLSFRQFLIFNTRWKSLKVFILKCNFHWWRPFGFIHHSLWENSRSISR